MTPRAWASLIVRGVGLWLIAWQSVAVFSGLIAVSQTWAFSTVSGGGRPEIREMLAQSVFNIGAPLGACLFGLWLLLGSGWLARSIGRMVERDGGAAG